MEDKIIAYHTPDELFAHICNMLCAYESGKLTRSEFVQIIAVNVYDSFIYGLVTSENESKD